VTQPHYLAGFENNRILPMKAAASLIEPGAKNWGSMSGAGDLRAVQMRHWVHVKVRKTQSLPHFAMLQ
jgi:hypothetical protein